jgi:hypothetical protein
MAWQNTSSFPLCPGHRPGPALLKKEPKPVISVNFSVDGGPTFNNLRTNLLGRLRAERGDQRVEGSLASLIACFPDSPQNLERR